MIEQSNSNDLRLESIPQPPGHLLIGNLGDIERGAMVQDLNRMAGTLGPIFKLVFPGRDAVFVSVFALVDELCDANRFDKMIGGGLNQVKAFTGDGLFTASTEDPNWQTAHRILLPAFGQEAMRGYLAPMLDIGLQLMKKWERLNRGDSIDVSTDTTRLALDTIGLCGFGYRFNSFYRDKSHPFVECMIRALTESLGRASRLPVQERVRISAHRQFEADIESMNALVDHLIKERRTHRNGEADGSDLLSYMLNGVDKQTGEGLDDVNIRYQIITFLIAGHETTSGLLSFTLFLLLHHPEVLKRAYAEVDAVLGTDPAVLPSFTTVHQLRYLSQALRESLRLWPTAPAFSVHPRDNEAVIGGRYRITREQGVTILVGALQRDPGVWGADAEEFNPDHFSPEAEQGRPANAFKPFGNGQRACIGRQFAMQEATLVLAMILQRFELIDHEGYQLVVKETLTIKPDNFKMQVKKRAHLRSGAAGAALR